MIRAFYAILLFVCIGIKPFYTVGYVAYYELNIDYIVEKYCVNKSKPELKCNGKCHLVKKIALTNAVDKKNTNKAIFNSLTEAFFPVFYQTSNYQLEIVELLDTQKSNWYVLGNNYHVSLSITSPPPRC